MTINDTTGFIFSLGLPARPKGCLPQQTYPPRKRQRLVYTSILAWMCQIPIKAKYEPGQFA
jgi:hypothetical protein